MQAVFPLNCWDGGFRLVSDHIVGFGIETNQEVILAPWADSLVRYFWWMVILLTPFMLTMAVVQAVIGNNKLAMNIIGAIVYFILNIHCMTTVWFIEWAY